MPPLQIPGLQGAGLTPREAEIVHLILGQLTNLAISLHLGCSVKTVEAHISSIFRKTHTTSRLDLVVKVMSAQKAGDGGAGAAPASD